MIKKPDFFKTILMIIAMVVPGGFLMAASLTTSQQPVDQSTTITTTCTRCHSLERVCAKLGTTPQKWQTILSRMQAKGSGLSNQHNTALAQFLSTTTTQDAGFCR